MSQKVTTYVSHGSVSSKTALNQNGNRHVLYYLFTLAGLIGKLFFLSNPLFVLTEQAINKQIDDQENISLADALAKANDHKKYFALAQFVLLKQLLMLILLILVGFVSVGFIYLGYTLDNLFDLDRYYIMSFFEVISGVLLVTSLLILYSYLFSIPTIISQSESMTLGEALKQNQQIMSTTSIKKISAI